MRLLLGIAAVMAVLVIAWLLAEIHADRKWRASIKPAVPAPLERLPPKSDV